MMSFANFKHILIFGPAQQLDNFKDFNLVMVITKSQTLKKAALKYPGPPNLSRSGPRHSKRFLSRSLQEYFPKIKMILK